MTTFKQTIPKKLWLLTLLASTSLSFAKLSNEAISDIYEKQIEGSAKYLEYHLIFKPQNQIQKESMHTSIGFSAAFASLLLLTTKTEFGKNNINVDIPTIITSGVICSAASYAYLCKLEKSILRNTLIDFLNNWSHHRQYLADEFATAFDELATHDINALTDDQISEIFGLVQHYIEHTFEKRYPKPKKTDMLSALKTITEIGKNIAPSAPSAK